MELFSEIYNCYYQVVDQILKLASLSPLTRKDMEMVAGENGYEESALVIIPKLIQGEWSLLEHTKDGFISKVDNLAVTPLTNLQKRWIKTLLSDRRIPLFFNQKQLHIMQQYLADEEPLFSMDDFLYFDRYADGDPYEKESYQSYFRVILKAIKEHRVLKFCYISGKQNLVEHSCLPCRIEYSSKDDKFRVLCLSARLKGGWRLETINLARILKLEESTFCVPTPPDLNTYLGKSLCQEPVVLRITNERNALERTMLHFSSYEKRTERTEGTNQYLCSIYYDKATETELLIQILSFGPLVQVLGPESFLDQVRERVRRQRELRNHCIDQQLNQQSIEDCPSL